MMNLLIILCHKFKHLIWLTFILMLWWKVVKYFYSSTVLKYSFEVLVLLLHFISEGYIVLFTAPHLF